MKSLIRIIPFTAISLLLFVGCKDFKKSTADTPAIIKTNDSKLESENRESKTSETSKKSKISEHTKDDFSPLLSVVSGTKTAVTGKKFDQAQKEFDKFENAWSKVEDGIRTKSATNYREIEDAESEVKKAIKAKDQEKALKGLQTIDKTISSISHISQSHK